MLKKISVLFFIFFIFLISSCSNSTQKDSVIQAVKEKDPQIKITDAKTVYEISENLMPVNPMEIFPEGTSKVSCWFQWKNAEINSLVVAKWDYLTDKIHILDYSINIPRKEGQGGISLTMPEGKKLPAGEYQLELNSAKKVLTSLTFKIE